MSFTLVRFSHSATASYKTIATRVKFVTFYTCNVIYYFIAGTSVCNGDSGGGLVISKYAPQVANFVWQLRGIVSVGVALQGGVCNPNQYTVFTDAAKYVVWIRNITSL